MFDILMDIGKSVLGEFIGGDDKGGSSGGGQMYDPAAERQTAMTASRDAINLTNSRGKNAQENRNKEQIKKQKEVADLIRSIKDTNVREALIAQVERQGLIDHSAIIKSRLAAASLEDTDTKVKPQTIGTA